jgi:hypothetical protein
LHSVRMPPEAVCSFDDWYQPLRQFALHYVIIHPCLYSSRTATTEVSSSVFIAV